MGINVNREREPGKDGPQPDRIRTASDPHVLTLAVDIGHSHSIVDGGFDEMSYTTRLMPRTSFTIRDEMRASRSCGSRAQSAVIPSRLSTARIATVYS